MKMEFLVRKLLDFRWPSFEAHNFRFTWPELQPMTARRTWTGEAFHVAAKKRLWWKPTPNISYKQIKTQMQTIFFSSSSALKSRVFSFLFFFCCNLCCKCPVETWALITLSAFFFLLSSSNVAPKMQRSRERSQQTQLLDNENMFIWINEGV